MRKQPYHLVITETSINFYTVTSPDLPNFTADVTGSFRDEAIDRAQVELLKWVARAKERGIPLPPERKGGIGLFTVGMSPITGLALWSKDDVRRATTLSRATVDRLIQRGIFRRYKIGRRVLFRPDQVIAAIESTNCRSDSP